MTINTTLHPPPAGRVPARSGWSPARLAYVFYTTAAAGAVIGQTWVALEHLPFPAGTPAGVKVAAVLPFALCLELLAMVLAAMGDARQRLGEAAYGFRVFSAVVATLAVGIIMVGHWSEPYLVAGFGTLSVSAYVLWLLHAAARRRDALRAAGKLDETAPAYGLYRRLRHPILVARAAELARAGTVDPDGKWRPLGLQESLRAAEEDRRAAARRPAIARAIDRVVRAEHADPLMAEIASATLDLDRIAAELAARADYTGWAARLEPAVAATPPTTGPDIEGGHARRSAADMSGHPPVAGADHTGRPATAVPAARARRTSSRTRGGQAGTVAERIAALLEQHPDMTRTELARQVGTSTRHVRRVLADMSIRTGGPDREVSGQPQADIPPAAGAAVSGHTRTGGVDLSTAAGADINPVPETDIPAGVPAAVNGHRPT